jgi:hypothetical protein
MDRARAADSSRRRDSGLRRHRPSGSPACLGWPARRPPRSRADVPVRNWMRFSGNKQVYGAESSPTTPTVNSRAPTCPGGRVSRQAPRLGTFRCHLRRAKRSIGSVRPPRSLSRSLEGSARAWARLRCKSRNPATTSARFSYGPCARPSAMPVTCTRGSAPAILSATSRRDRGGMPQPQAHVRESRPICGSRDSTSDIGLILSSAADTTDTFCRSMPRAPSASAERRHRLDVDGSDARHSGCAESEGVPGGRAAGHD